MRDDLQRENGSAVGKRFRLFRGKVAVFGNESRGCEKDGGGIFRPGHERERGTTGGKSERGRESARRKIIRRRGEDLRSRRRHDADVALFRVRARESGGGVL